MYKMNKIDIAVTESNNCKGKCLLEMQKTLPAEVISEFLETVRDFYNDDETSSKMKNIIISETNEIVELINKKASELCSFIDEVFLHRRQQQSSFYILCHKLARKATPEGIYLPDESKCICFSEENLKTYDVDSTADSKVKLIFNLEAVKEAVEEICGKLLCTKCKRSSTFGSAKYSMNPDCNCTVPSFSSQHKIHEAILDICMNKDPKSCADSWYLTHLKRDADYYRQKASSFSVSSDNSVDSFEVISPEDIQFDNNIGMDLSELNPAEEKSITVLQPALQTCPDSPRMFTEDVCSQISSSVKFKKPHFKSSGEPHEESYEEFVVRNNYFLKECNYKWGPGEPDYFQYLTKYDTNTESFAEFMKKELMPSDIVKYSFLKFLDPYDIMRFKSSSLNNSNPEDEISSTAFEACDNLKSRGIGFKKMNAAKASIDHSLKVNPSDALKNAFNFYFNKEDMNKWLLK